MFQFPLYWYSSPSLLKKWIDEVIIYGWAYGSKGKRIFYNRKLGLAISAGVKKREFTSMGKNKHTLTQMLTPFNLYVHRFMLNMYQSLYFTVLIRI
ncbi:NAD(P)H-dependent oxidoreductase [Staphylococcus aureus]